MQLAISLTLARLLAPEHFGLLGMATVVSGFVKRCSDLGFRASIVQRKDIDPLFLSTVFWTNLAVYTLVAAGLVLASPIVAMAYREPQVQAILVALALNFIVVAFSAIPTALLQRELRFKSLATRELLSTFVGGGVAIGLAIGGWGVWALVSSTLIVSVTSAVLLNLVRPVRILFRFDWNRLRESLSFGLFLTAADIFNYISRNADNLIIGLTLGPVALGYYTFAYRLMLLPRDSLTQVVNRVLFPKLSREQDDDKVLASISLRACCAVAFISFPMMAGLALLAEPFTRIVVGEKWLPAVPVIWILAPLGALQSLWPMATYLILAKGRSDVSFRWSVVSGCVCMASFVIGSNWGIIGVAASYAVASLVLIPATFSVAYRLVPTLTLRSLANGLAPYLLATLFMSGLTVPTFYFSKNAAGLPLAMILTIIVGIASYGFIAFRVQLPALRLFLDVMHFAKTKPVVHSV